MANFAKFKVISFEVQLGSRIAIPTSYVDAIIRCYGPNGEVFIIGIVSPDESVVPQNTSVFTPKVEGGIYSKNGNLYSWYIDALRNETDIYALVDSATYLNRIMFTSNAGWGHY